MSNVIDKNKHTCIKKEVRVDASNENPFGYYNNYYYLTNNETDNELRECIDTMVDRFLEMLNWEGQNLIENRLELTLPYKENRIAELEKFFDEYLLLYESNLGKGNPGFDEKVLYYSLENLVKQRKYFYYRSIEKVLSFDKKTNRIFFDGNSFSYAESTSDPRYFVKENQLIQYLITLDWIKKQILIEKGEIKEPLPETQTTNSKDKLSHKQQILLLDRLGIFDLPEIQNLTGIHKEKLFGYLLNRDEKNTGNYIRNKDLDKKNVSMDKDFVRTPDNLKKVNDLLKQIGLEKL